MPEKRNRGIVKTCGSAGDPVPSAHADVCDLTYGRGHLASFGLLSWRRTGRQARSGITGWVCHSRYGVWSGPSSGSRVALPTRVVKRGAPPSGWESGESSSPRSRVRRCSSRSRLGATVL